VTVTAIGNQRHYQANPASPVFEALRALVLRTVALSDPLRAALTPLRAKIHEAFVFGSVARGTERAASDVDLFVVSDTLSYAALYAALAPVDQQLARTVNPILLTLEEWQSRLKDDGSFASRVKRGDRIVLI
jgi:predicted nucleotidyltransferase